MDSRYVCRSLEDGIGQLPVADVHPHSTLLRRLRFATHERLDYAKVLALEIQTLSSIAGNPRIDPGKIYETCREHLSDVHASLFPYAEKRDDNRKATAKAAKEGKYDRYFRILREMDRKSQEKQEAAQKPVQPAPQETRPSKDGIIVVRR